MSDALCQCVVSFQLHDCTCYLSDGVLLLGMQMADNVNSSSERVPMLPLDNKTGQLVSKTYYSIRLTSV